MDQSDPWPFIRSTFHKPELGSTNDWARELISEGLASNLPALIWADRQIRGRGQGANLWWSDEGSLTASVVFDPEVVGLGVRVRPRVALGVASAVVAAITRVAPDCRAGIRWPNDVEVGGRKLGGILVEAVTTPEGPRLIVGIGLNVGTRIDQAPESVGRLATSLTDYGLTAASRRPVLASILDELTPMLDLLSRDDPRLAARWNDLDCLAGTWITAQVGDIPFRAFAEGIDPTGGLRIRRMGEPPEILYAARILRDS